MARDQYTDPNKISVPNYPFTKPSNSPEPVEQPVNPTAHGEVKDTLKEKK